MNKAPQGLLVLKIVHKAMHDLVPVFLFLSSLIFCYSLYQPLPPTPILSTSHPNMFIFLDFSKHYLFCPQHSLLGLSWLFFIVHSNQVPINTFRQPSLKCPVICVRSFPILHSSSVQFSPSKHYYSCYPIACFLLDFKLLEGKEYVSVCILFTIVSPGLNVKSRECQALRIYLQNKETGVDNYNRKNPSLCHIEKYCSFKV